MVECNFIKAPNIHRNLNDQQFRLNKVNEVIRLFYCRDQRKRIASFEYFDKSLFYLQQVVAILLHHLQLLLVHRSEAQVEILVLNIQCLHICKEIVRNNTK